MWRAVCVRERECVRERGGGKRVIEGRRKDAERIERSRYVSRFRLLDERARRWPGCVRAGVV